LLIGCCRNRNKFSSCPNERRGTAYVSKSVPQQLKPSSEQAIYGTAEAVPFVDSLFPEARRVNEGFDLCTSPVTTSVSVSADTPPGNYEISVNAQLSTGYQPYYNPQAVYNPIATVAATHTFGVGVTVTPAAAPAPPSFQLAASPADISIAAGGSFPVQFRFLPATSRPG
jgi:hypothetical protein